MMPEARGAITRIGAFVRKRTTVTTA
jgi:hypothetical protein